MSALPANYFMVVDLPANTRAEQEVFAQRSPRKEESAEISVESPDFPMRKRWDRSMAELASIRRYQDDWDGQGAVAPRPEIINIAYDVMAALRLDSPNSPPDAVAASPLGTILIIWQSPRYDEIEILEDGRIESKA